SRFGRCLRAWSVPPLPVWAACCHLGGYSDQPGQLDEIIGSHCQRELEVELLNAAQHWPRQSADGLAPPEWLLNPLALLLADLVSTMADSATIDGGESIGRVLRQPSIPRSDRVQHFAFSQRDSHASVCNAGSAPSDTASNAQ